ncbi:DUF4350 domain-containing protein [Micromonospora sp. NPDC051196]|uniref:DUF4350 domain-containing protein n=1 Tax=Micromonospora sp. NPDC051196 TaxID=3155281 RepID=UPI003412AFB9
MSAPKVRRRRHRIVIPVLLSALVITTTLVTHAIDQPDQTDVGFLSPLATGDDGGSRLAASLAGRGVEVRRETDTLAALRATRSGPATLFVPAPELLHPQTLDHLDLLPGHTRLVLVDPSRRVLAAAGLPLRPAGRRWAAQAVAPHLTGPCALPEVTGATAAVARQRYAPTGAPGSADFCYSAGLARLPGPAESVVVVGASDPFRNGRIGEWDNELFATGLLATTGRVLWLDLDGPEPAPPTPSATPAAPPPEPDDEPDDDQDDLVAGDSTETTPGQPSGGNASGSGEPGREQSANPIWSAFPPWFWALLAQLALAALLIAVARARRFGPPIPEPLPVTVPAAEAVFGRARLYQRAKARGSTAEVLRAAAKARLGRRLHLPADGGDVAAAVAAETGAHPDTVRELLDGSTPDTDHELLKLAGDLDRAARAPKPSADRPPPRSQGDLR